MAKSKKFPLDGLDKDLLRNIATLLRDYEDKKGAPGVVSCDVSFIGLESCPFSWDDERMISETLGMWVKPAK
jgi:hypothetical protein